MLNPADKARVVILEGKDFLESEAVTALKALYSVKTFTDSDEACAYLREHGTAVLLLGYQFWREGVNPLRNVFISEPRLARIPVVFLATDPVDPALDAGEQFYLAKPVRPGELRSVVRTHLELGRYRQNFAQMVEERTTELMARYSHQKHREDATLNLLAYVTDMRGSEEGAHLARITAFTGVMVTELQKSLHPAYVLDDAAASNIIRAVKLHDIGKVNIPEAILAKPEKLSEEELEQVKQHPVYGAALIDEYVTYLGEDSFIQTVRDIVLCHHEKWDGTGYPSGLKGKSIPLAARIAAIADVYDALTTVRAYKPAISHEQAIVVIKSHSGKYFDPFLVNIFLEVEARFKEMSQTVI